MTKSKTPSMNAMLKYLGSPWQKVKLSNSWPGTVDKPLWECTEPSSYHQIFRGRTPLVAVRRAYRAAKKREQSDAKN